MPNALHTQIRKSLKNKNLQTALDFNAGKRVIARKQSYESLGEDIQILRQRAHAVRLETVTHLDTYLQQFISNVEKHGVIIHRAETAQNAFDIILNIVQSNHAKLIAKSKSMVSEEIGLNHRLEHKEIKVVETDLGEYIVQLRGEPPAHIITPAVHLRREDVGELFSCKLGIPYTEDIPTLTSVARQVLRQTFLEAEIGFSGVNFGVAETGTMCIVTNEGNGRMVTTLPPVHIALMGMERIVPTQKDLGLMLQLLPRSATGQKLSVYTSLINSPRQAGELDGPHERHLVLLDNGRKLLQTSALAEALLCIRCGACLNVCPVFQEIGGHGYVNRHGQISPYSGPIGSVISPSLLGIEEYGQLARASSLCGACKEACPIDIDLPKLLLRIRAGGSITPTRKVPPNVPLVLSSGLKMFSWIATHVSIYRTAQKLAGTFSNLLFPRQNFLPFPAITGWGYGKDFPKPPKKSFQHLWRSGSIHNTTSPRSSESLNISEVDHKPQTMPFEQFPTNNYERFASELDAVGGKLIRSNPQQLAQRVSDTLVEKGISQILAWDKEQLPVNLLDGLEKRGISICHQINPTIKAGLTGAKAGIADTGSILVHGGRGRPLTTSLLPNIHLAILNNRDIFHNLEDMLAQIRLDDYSSTVIITGPSRTADIEMALTIGVHGPKEIIVFCLVEEG
jgi:L-lactate dehydrogenase complex protein LldF